MNLRRKKYLLIGILTAFTISCSTIKTPPLGVNYESPLRDSDNVEFHYDLTYLDKDGNIRYDRQIWEATYKVVDEAKDYLIVEMFLLNDIYNKDKEHFPEFAKEYTRRLIKKKMENPDLKVYVLSDENNNLYGAFEHPFITDMKNAGIDVIMVDIFKLKDTFPWYSPIWRTLIAPHGNPQGKGWIGNFYGPMWPKLTLRNLLRALNVKADHRKIFLNEENVVVSSANIHDPSYFHENVAISANGEITKDVLHGLQLVAEFSDGKIDVTEKQENKINNRQIENLTDNQINEENNFSESETEKQVKEIENKKKEFVEEETRRFAQTGELPEKSQNSENENQKNGDTITKFDDENNKYQLQFVTEAKIGEHLDKDIDGARAGDEILMGMYFLADKGVVDRLIKAANRGVKVRIIFDRSRDAFGMSTNGLPNKPVSKKLKKKTKNKIEVKWYFTNNEQYHTKITLIKKTDGNVIIHTGSANLIKKNIRGYIMDANFRILTNKNSKLTKDIYTYFDRLWENKDGLFTINFDDEPTTKASTDFMYKILDATQLGSF
ncbi:phospholipase D family protein [Leptotrichia massiliensis]|uniref:phospholipase D family protein n=1 Tax=Leptotrichia massiliensis TaxID=1852388 RepID=UPI0028E3538B|nr:phospholipase D family protein [Leptotrichia massiliensis]